MNKLGIVYMGTAEFATAPLEALLKDERFDVQAVVSQPDKAQGRRMQLLETPVKRVALKHGVKVFQPRKLRDGVLSKELKALAPDFIVTCAYGRILPEDILSIPKFEALNLHASLLPKYRGAAPIQWTIFNGDEEAGVSLMRMDLELDHGAVFAQEKMAVDPDDHYETLSTKLSQVAAELAVKYIPQIAEGKLDGIEQAHEQASFTRILIREDGAIDWNKSADAIGRQIRATYPWPASYSFFQGKRLKIYKARDLSSERADAALIDLLEEAIAGQLIKYKKQLFVVCGKRAKSLLQVLELQAEGGKRLAAGDFSQRLKGGEVLTAHG